MVIDKRILIPFWLLLINAFALDITNDGNMCLYNKVFKEPAAVTGSGCITIEEKSAIYLSESHLSIPSTQDIYLANGESSIVVKAETRPKTFNVYGFGNGNRIGLDAPLKGIYILGYPAYSYNSGSGILTMRAGSRAQNFNIGKGYDPMLFSIVSDELVGLSTLLGSIQYNGPVPERTLSNSCQLECNSFSNYQTSANDILIDDESDPKGISFLGKRSENPSLLICYVGGEEVGVVEYETGVCDFTIPDNLETFFHFTSTDNYDIQYYFASIDGQKFTTDVASSGRVISIPAKLLNNVALELNKIHLKKSSASVIEPSSVSTATEDFEKRDYDFGDFDDLDDWLGSIDDGEGEPIDVTISAGTGTESSTTIDETSIATESSSAPTIASSVPAEPTSEVKTSSTDNYSDIPVESSSVVPVESSSVVPVESSSVPAE
nr:hypothetical protein [Asgard group archaeon]